MPCGIRIASTSILLGKSSSKASQRLQAVISTVARLLNSWQRFYLRLADLLIHPAMIAKSCDTRIWKIEAGQLDKKSANNVKSTQEIDSDFAGKRFYSRMKL